MTTSTSQTPMPLRLADVLEFLIAKGPGRTERELAEAVFGQGGYQQRVNQDCSLLVANERVECRGAGGAGDPFTYWPKT